MNPGSSSTGNPWRSYFAKKLKGPSLIDSLWVLLDTREDEPEAVVWCAGAWGNLRWAAPDADVEDRAIEVAFPANWFEGTPARLFLPLLRQPVVGAQVTLLNEDRRSVAAVYVIEKSLDFSESEVWELGRSLGVLE